MIRFAVIGTNTITDKFLQAASALPDFKLCAVYSRTLARAQEYAQKNNVSLVFDSLEALADSDQIDAVYIASPNFCHAAQSILMMQHHKHVLCEKPMATTLADCEAMVAAARESGKFLMIGQNQRLTKAHQKARQLVADGVLGDILTFRTTFGHGGPETWSVDPGKNTWFFDKSKAAMGAMADLGIHKTDLIQYLLGQTVVEATAKVTTLDKRGADGQLIGVDDNAICIYRMSGGAIGTMTASWTYYGAEDNSTVLYGTKGILRIYDDPAYSLKLITAGGEKVLYELEAIQTNDNQTASGIDLDGVGDHLAAGQHAAHSHMALGKAVAEGDGVHLKGDASRLPHAVLDQLADAVEVDVPGMHLVIGIDDADKRLGQLLVDQTHAPQMGPGTRHAQAVHYLGAWVLWVLINQIHRFTHANLPPSSLFFDTRMG